MSRRDLARAAYYSEYSARRFSKREPSWAKRCIGRREKIDALWLFMRSGNFTNGTIHIYGMPAIASAK